MRTHAPQGAGMTYTDPIRDKFLLFLDEFLCQSWLAQLILYFDSKLGVLRFYFYLKL